MTAAAEITADSRLRDVWAHPLGRDVLEKILLQMGRSPAWVTNPLVSRIRLRTLARIRPLTPEFTGALITLLNTHRDVPAAGPITHWPAPGEEVWWKHAVFYQIYPRSFSSSRGDQTGDLRGIISRLDYLAALGIDAIWLSPIYDSPGDDNGYDIRNYRAVSAEFGTLADLDELIAALHERGMRLVMDLVINHTSDEHPWFQAALASADSPYRDYYFFRAGDPGDPTGTRPPNNWVSFFSGPAWRYFPAARAWAMHLFSAKQMDLNWDHPPLREEIYDMVRWWRDRGVDGFRLDVINYISKPADLPDGEKFVGDLMEFTGIEHYFAGPRLHEHLRELRRRAFDPGMVAIGETPGVGVNLARLLTEPARGELDLVFTFDHLETPGHTRFDDYRYDLNFLRDYLQDYLTRYGHTCWPTLFYENHDNPRMISKVDPRPEHRVGVGQLLALLQLTLRGTPFIYQGQEIGAVNAPFETMADLADVESHGKYADLLAAGHHPQSAWATVLAGTRDHSRVAMDWAEVERQESDPTSVAAAYRDLIALRRAHPALVYGDTRFGPRVPGRWSYTRLDESGAPAFRVEANLTDAPAPFPEPPAATGPEPTGPWRLVFATGEAAPGTLGPYEGRLYLRGGTLA